MLNGLSNLPDAVVIQLARHEGCGLGFCGLTSLSRTVAGSMCQYDGELFLDGVRSLSDEVAEILSHHKRNLFSNGVNSLSPIPLDNLKKHKGYLSIDGMKIRIVNE